MYEKIDIPVELLKDENSYESLKSPNGYKISTQTSAPNFTLYRIVRYLRPKQILEIGTQAGVSLVTMALASYMNGINSDIVSIDPFIETGDNSGIDTFKIWYKNVHNSGFQNNIQLILSKSEQVLPYMNKKFDFIFVDGSHRYIDVKKDCIMALGLLNDGGYFLVHDYKSYKSVKRACDEIIEMFNLPFWVNDLQKNDRDELCGWVIIRKVSGIKFFQNDICCDLALKGLKLVESQENDFIVKIKNKIKGTKTYIWGAGDHTKELLFYMKKYNYDMTQIKGIIDSDEKKNGTIIENIKVISKSHVLELDNDSISDIIISSACFEEEIYNEIKNIFKNHNINVIRLYDSEIGKVNPI